MDTSKICVGLWIQSPVAQTPRVTQASCCYLLVFFLSLGCRTLTLQDTLLRRTAPTSAALPVQFLLTRPRASPWRALTMWVGTHELLQLSDSTSQQLAVPFTSSSSHLHHLNPPRCPSQWSGSGLERLVVFSTVQHCLTLSSPDLTAAIEQS